MLLMIAGIVLLFAHVWGIKQYLTSYREKEGKAMALAAQSLSYKNSASNAELIAKEVDWVDKHEPKPSTYDDEKTKLLDFLESSGVKHGCTTTKPDFPDEVDSEGKYQRAKVQIQATATEDQIYKWLVDIHQPTKFRAVTQIVMRPTAKVDDDGLIICTLTAEQWLIASNSDSL